jgi:hypothetical protein
MRIAITGGPRTGKTTLAKTAAGTITVRSTDDVKGLGWSEASASAATWFDAQGSICIEGVAVPRALRKWLAAHPTGKPVDEIYVLTVPLAPQTPGQAAMGKGVMTVLAEITPELRRRGVKITEGRVGLGQ